MRQAIPLGLFSAYVMLNRGIPITQLSEEQQFSSHRGRIQTRRGLTECGAFSLAYFLGFGFRQLLVNFQGTWTCLAPWRTTRSCAYFSLTYCVCTLM